MGVWSESGALRSGWKPRSQLAGLCGILSNRNCETKAGKTGHREGRAGSQPGWSTGRWKGLGVGVGLMGHHGGWGPSAGLPIRVECVGHANWFGYGVKVTQRTQGCVLGGLWCHFPKTDPREEEGKEEEESEVDSSPAAGRKCPQAERSWSHSRRGLLTSVGPAPETPHAPGPGGGTAICPGGWAARAPIGCGTTCWRAQALGLESQGPQSRSSCCERGWQLPGTALCGEPCWKGEVSVSSSVCRHPTRPSCSMAGP